jgi:hypothetical protein
VRSRERARKECMRIGPTPPLVGAGKPSTQTAGLFLGRPCFAPKDAVDRRSLVLTARQHTSRRPAQQTLD